MHLPEHTIVEELGLAGLPEPEREALLAEVGELIYHSVMRRAWTTLAHTEQEELTRLLKVSAEQPDDAEGADELASFLEANVPDLTTYIEDEIAGLKHAYQSSLQQL